eukprot:g40509.t1
MPTVNTEGAWDLTFTKEWYEQLVVVMPRPCSKEMGQTQGVANFMDGNLKEEKVRTESAKPSYNKQIIFMTTVRLGYLKGVRPLSI